MAPPTPDLILPNLYLSDQFPTKAPALLQKYNITHILTLIPSFTLAVTAEQTESIDPYHKRSQPSIYSELQVLESLAPLSWDDGPAFKLKSWLRIEVEDAVDEDLLRWFQRCIAFIDEGRKEGNNVLVHCQMGISRSGSAVVAYVMQNMKLDAETALAFVRESRRRVNPNVGFMKQLGMYHRLEYSIYEPLQLSTKKVDEEAPVLQRPGKDETPDFDKVAYKLEYLGWKAKEEAKFSDKVITLQHKLAGIVAPNESAGVPVVSAAALKSRVSLLSSIENSHKNLGDGKRYKKLDGARMEDDKEV